MLKQVYRFAILTRAVTVLLALLTYYFIGSYDSSAEIQLGSTKNLSSAFLRWDALYFLHIAEHGYVYEQETAFFPMMPILSKILTQTLFSPLKHILGLQCTLLLSGIVISNVSFIFAAGALYKLTLALLPRNQKLAYVSSIAFCLSPPSMFMSSFYTESLFAFVSFTGMQYIAQKQYFHAAILWGFTSSIRSNAIIFAGFFFYDLVWIRSMRRISFYAGIIKSIFYTALTICGFAMFQVYGYRQFCSLDRPWCHSRLPLLYSFVQSEYWDVGFMSYYEIKQIPNFVLAAPIVLISIYGLVSYIHFDRKRFFSIGFRPDDNDNTFYSSKLLVYMYLWLFLLFYALTSMHVQVIIRFFTSLPPFYWFVGHLWIKGFQQKENIRAANIVLGYFVLYGLIGTVLFANFLPPA